eukprot:PhF_6_TR13603/c0_g1_i2/m.21769
MSLRPTSADKRVVRPISARGQRSNHMMEVMPSPPKSPTKPSGTQAVEDDVSAIHEDSSAFVSEESSSEFVQGPIKVVAKPIEPSVIIPALEQPQTSVFSPLGDNLEYKVSKEGVLGKGTFGTVYKAMNQNNMIFALKEIPAEVAPSSSEVQLLRHLTHPNIVKFLGCRENGPVLEIHMELVNGGSLSGVIRSFKLAETQIKLYVKDILLGLEYLHSKNVIHRDLKCDNILVEDGGRAKLADFGTARETTSRAHTVAGTPAFMAPEVLKGNGYDNKCDIWSLGCCIIHMHTGDIPFKEFANPYAAMFHVAQMNQEDLEKLIPPDCSPDMK